LKDKTKNRICFLALVLTLSWSVFVFGAVAGAYRVIAGLLAGVSGLLCLIFLEKKKRMPPVPILLWLCIAVLFLFGWYMTINARADHSLEAWVFAEVEDRPLDFDWAPGTITLSSSLRALIELTLTLIALLAAVRSAESGGWRVLGRTIAIFGALVSLTGLLHKALGAGTVWWINDEYSRAVYFFAPFVYNANAGAFLNLCLPLAIGLSLRGWHSRQERSLQAFWTLVAVVIMAGVLATASKGSLAIMVLLLAAMLLWNGKRVYHLGLGFFAEKRRRTERMVFMVILWVMALAFVALGIETTVKRWDEFMARFGDSSRTSNDAREGMMHLMVRMAGPEEGSWHGFGAGSYAHLVPYFAATAESGEEPVAEGRWLHGHSDPLQTLVEWGYLGAGAWFLLGIGAVGCGVLVARSPRLSRADVPLVRGMVVSIVMVGLHSTFDFPLSVYALHLVAILLRGACWGLYGVQRADGRAAARRASVEAE
jgi:O-antigen ligase